MYALGNFEKFVADHADGLGDQAQGILERAREVAAQNRGIISADAADEVFIPGFKNLRFLRQFKQDAQSPEHMEIGLAALRAAAAQQQP